MSQSIRGALWNQAFDHFTHEDGRPMWVQRLVRRLERLSKIADGKIEAAGGWTPRPPTRRGLWFQAVWQKAGYYHVQRFPLDSTVKYLRAQAREVWHGSKQQWCGPFTKQQSAEEWTRHVNPPNEKAERPADENP